MKNIVSKIILVCLMVLSVIGLAGCGLGADDGTHKTINKDKTINIGILQIATHGALDLAREGFVEALQNAGYEDGKNIKITVKNPEGDTANLQLMAYDLVRSSDLVLAIATDAAKAVKTACDNEGIRIPVLFTAVTDAVDAKLVESNENVGGRVTGTSDINPVKEQIALAKEIKPGVKKIGVLYTANETNSKVQSDMAKKQAELDNIEVVEGTVTGATDIAQVTRSIIQSGAEMIYIPTDNNIVKNMGAVAQITNELKIPVICGEMDTVKNGGLITYGISYKTLGNLTGEMAVEIINGTQAKDLAVKSLPASRCTKFINMDVAEEIGITLSDEILKGASLYTAKEK